LIATSVSGRTDELECQYSSGTLDFNSQAFDNIDNWTVISTEGDKPAPRFTVRIKFLYPLSKPTKTLSLAFYEQLEARPGDVMIISVFSLMD
jgi:hypothetical protein